MNLASYVASEYFFSERAVDLFNEDDVPENKLELNKKFILYLVEHGLDIAHLMAPTSLLKMKKNISAILLEKIFN